MDKTRKESIIRYVDVIKNTVGSSDPIDIANYFEYKVSYLEDEQKEVLTAKTTKYKNKNIILINKAYPIRGRMVLCAHELGHIILKHDIHKPGSGRFDGSNYQNEYEANLFAVALLFDQNDFNMKFSEMSYYTLKSIIDCNLE